MKQEASDRDKLSIGNNYINRLFKCVNEGDRAGPGVIDLVKQCSRCKNRGSGKSDHCA